MIRFLGPLGVISVLVVSILFAAWNGAERVTLNLGVTVLYGVPLTLVGFAGLFLGMVVMLVAGVRSDLEVRALLRQRLEDEDREERAIIDRAQQDLFSQPPFAEQRVADGGEVGSTSREGPGDRDAPGRGAGTGDRHRPGPEAGGGALDPAAPVGGARSGARDVDEDGDDDGDAIGKEEWDREGGAVG